MNGYLSLTRPGRLPSRGHRGPGLNYRAVASISQETSACKWCRRSRAEARFKAALIDVYPKSCKQDSAK